MESRGRSWFLLWGSVIAFIGFSLPAVYAVHYTPPANSGLPTPDPNQLQGFHTFLGLTSYNGFYGPYDLKGVLIAIIALFCLGLLALVMDFDTAYNLAKKIAILFHHTIALVAAVYSVGLFIVQFRINSAPAAIRQKFADDLGGGQTAIAASHYVTASLGLPAFVLFFGLLFSMIGVFPTVFSVVTILYVVVFLIFVIFDMAGHPILAGL